MKEESIKLIQEFLRESCKTNSDLKAEIDRVMTKGVRYTARDPYGDWFYFVEEPQWRVDGWNPTRSTPSSREYWGEYALRATYVIESAKEWIESLGVDNSDLLVDLGPVCNRYISTDRFDTIRAIEL